MAARVLDGKRIRDEIKAELVGKVRALKAAGITPGLAAVLVGTNPASEVYVRNKVKTSAALGLFSEKIDLPASTSTLELLDLVDRLNHREEIDGILIQLPLPPQVDQSLVLNAVDPAKDVDGLHPINVGRLVRGNYGLVPCTPAGVIEILKRSGIPIRGARAVVIGRSDIVGKPVSLLLLHEDATVTICHSKTRELPSVAREADILIAAIGRPALVDDTYVKDGAVVIDVGVNRLEPLDKIRELFGEDPQRLADHARKGYTLVGDVHPRVHEKASYMTPVPGGVGPLTVAMLMANTVRAAAAQAQISVFA